LHADDRVQIVLYSGFFKLPILEWAAFFFAGNSVLAEDIVETERTFSNNSSMM
jgi:hypothetical protein